MIPKASSVKVAAASALLVGALVAVGGCTDRKDSGSCTHTKLTAKPVHLASQTAPLTLQATATGDGRPLAAFRLQFFLTFAGPTKLVGQAGKVDNLTGYAMTDSAGVATFRLTKGPAGVALPGERAVGYTVRLTFGNPINGVTYCGSSVRTTFS